MSSQPEKPGFLKDLNKPHYPVCTLIRFLLNLGGVVLLCCVFLMLAANEGLAAIGAGIGFLTSLFYAELLRIAVDISANTYATAQNSHAMAANTRDTVQNTYAAATALREIRDDS